LHGNNLSVLPSIRDVVPIAWTQKGKQKEALFHSEF
jgi:hypothetical protein